MNLHLRQSYSLFARLLLLPPFVNAILAGPSFIFILQIPFPVNPFLSHPYKTPGGVGHKAGVRRKCRMEGVQTRGIA
jgi:hypothetical protein